MWDLGKRRVVGLADVEEDLEDERLASLRHVDDLRTHRGGNTVHLCATGTSPTPPPTSDATLEATIGEHTQAAGRKRVPRFDSLKSSGSP